MRYLILRFTNANDMRCYVDGMLEGRGTSQTHDAFEIDVEDKKHPRYKKSAYIVAEKEGRDPKMVLEG